MRLILDVEGNDLFEKATRIHCFVTKDADTGKVRRFRAHSPVGSGESIQEGLEYVSKADEVIGFNSLSYDLPVLSKLYPWFAYKGKHLDLQVCCRLIWTDLMERDCEQQRIPKDCWGLQSLKAWGYRLKILKGSFGENADWSKWTQAMEDYCVQDVEVTHALLKLVESKKYSPIAIELEHEFKKLIVLQERHGFRFDIAGAEKFTAQLQCSRLEITDKLKEVFPPRIETLKTPAYYYVELPIGDKQYPTKGEAKKAGWKDAQIKPGPLRTKSHPFNPGSRQQIASRLIERYGWKPKKFTEPSANFPKGQIAIDEAVLAAMPWPEAKLLLDFLLVDKLLGAVAEGDKACLKLAINGRIHGSVNTNGAVTGRCTHSKPNVAQTPAVMVAKGEDGKKRPVLGLDGGFGWEFRSLYLADEGHVLVGWDASGLELRCLAHFLSKYDGGAFERLLLEGDPHTANQNAAGLWLRDSAKTFIYAYLYGAGDEKLGKIARQDCIDAQKPLPKGTLKQIGMNLRSRFEKNFSALARLKKAIKATLKGRNYLVGLDGRHLHVRSDHAALNTLLQSAGALLMKRALVFQYLYLTGLGYVYGKDFAFVANIHDEVQTSCRPEIAEIVGKSGPAALKKSGESFGFRCRLDGEYKVGRTWAETH